MRLKFKKLNDNATLPSYGSEGAACMDLYSSVYASIKPGQSVVIPTGLAVAIEDGFEGQIRSRSGIAMRHNVTVQNQPGTIDSDFRGEIGILLRNEDSHNTFCISIGDRIAQLAIAPVLKVSPIFVSNLEETDRGEGGWGSTGVK